MSTKSKTHGIRLTIDELLEEMDKVSRAHLTTFNRALAGEEKPLLGAGFHAGVVSSTAIWHSYVSKLKIASPEQKLPNSKA